MLLKDWRRLMGRLQVDILAAAADTYIMSAQRFFPTPGQLHTVAEKLWQMRKLLAKHARDTLSLIATLRLKEPLSESHRKGRRRDPSCR